MSEPTLIERLAKKSHDACMAKGWKRDWNSGGCYLHLEASEFIEALRGKGDDPPAVEAADILFVLLSMLEEEGISPTEVLHILDKKCDEIMNRDFDAERACICSLDESEEMTRHATACPARQSY